MMGEFLPQKIKSDKKSRLSVLDRKGFLWYDMYIKIGRTMPILRFAGTKAGVGTPILDF